MFGGYEIPVAAVVVGRQSEICSGGVLQIRHGAAKLDKGIGVDLPIGVRAMDTALDTNLSYNGTSSAEAASLEGEPGTRMSSPSLAPRRRGRRYRHQENGRR